MFEDDQMKSHNQGEKDAAEGKDRSKPWPRPFESDESYQARCNAYDKGYFHTTGQKDGAVLKWTKSSPTTRFLESAETDKLRESAYRKGYESGARTPQSNNDPDADSQASMSSETTISSSRSYSGYYSGSTSYPVGSSSAGRRNASWLILCLGAFIGAVILYNLFISQDFSNPAAVSNVPSISSLRDGHYRQFDCQASGPSDYYTNPALSGKYGTQGLFTITVQDIEVTTSELKVHFTVRSNIGEDDYMANENLFMVGTGMPGGQFDPMYPSPYLLVHTQRFDSKTDPVLRGNIGTHLYDTGPYKYGGRRLLKIKLRPREEASGFFAFPRPQVTFGSCNLVIPRINGWQNELVVRNIQLIHHD